MSPIVSLIMIQQRPRIKGNIVRDARGVLVVVDVDEQHTVAVWQWRPTDTAEL
ncbi:hypothetical protein TRAPUB_2921 [Trametes pubescens]|uniref:Uncharacterized protein n=1 Tax=Trametes pubescens TaxID=154538 RepID=A0A1M2VF85_TRAPU|nr:hypothetical protein TRAPUB_2921 [Trametes pubescens]